jgi:hypothetical protein
MRPAIKLLLHSIHRGHFAVELAGRYYDDFHPISFLWGVENCMDARRQVLAFRGPAPPQEDNSREMRL